MRVFSKVKVGRDVEGDRAWDILRPIHFGRPKMMEEGQEGGGQPSIQSKWGGEYHNYY